MKKILLLVTYFMCLQYTQAQVDSVNTKSNTLRLDKLKNGNNTYVVYIQDSLNGPKYNFELWERIIDKNATSNKNTLVWNRYQNNKTKFYKYIIGFTNKLEPISEEVYHEEIKDGITVVTKKHFIYNGNQMHSNPDSNKHTAKPVEVLDLKNSFNWELDLETFSTLPLAKDKKFAINFYHPGSKIPPKYYDFVVDRSEKLTFNNKSLDCWVVKVVYSKKQSSEFWIDKSTYNVLQMREYFYGKYRFKKLIA